MSDIPRWIWSTWLPPTFSINKWRKRIRTDSSGCLWIQVLWFGPASRCTVGLDYDDTEEEETRQDVTSRRRGMNWLGPTIGNIGKAREHSKGSKPLTFLTNTTYRLLHERKCTWRKGMQYGYPLTVEGKDLGSSQLCRLPYILLGRQKNKNHSIVLLLNLL